MKNHFYKLLVLLLILLVLPALAFAGLEVKKTTNLASTSLERMQSNGEYVVEIFKDDKWHEAGSLSFDQHLRDREIDLSKFITDNESLKIRLTEKGGGGAHIDSVLLGGISPQELKGSEDKLALKKLSKKDFDVIDAYKKTIELSFSSKEDMRLTLTARIENEIISKLPFQFPLRNSIAKIDENSAFYPYSINSNLGSIKVDGNIDDEGFSKPFFKEFSRTGSGHPSDYTYGWVRNDENNLYVALDFVPDNTMDGEKDYAKVYVKTPAGVREFKASVPEQKWGKPGFTYTGQAGYQHKVYEFSIPFGELGIENIADGEKMELAFAAYGTAAAALDFGDAPDTYGTLAASGGASHGPVQDGYWYLGYCNESDPDGQPTAGADGDDTETGGATIPSFITCDDDEDGVIFTTPLVPGLDAGVDVLVGMDDPGDSCFVSAYLDFNIDGDFLDAGEMIISQLLAPGVNSLTFAVPADASIGTTYSRFRCASPFPPSVASPLSTGPADELLPKLAPIGALPPTGSYPNGEVEDHMVTISSPECTAPPSGMVSWWGGDNNALDMIGVNDGTMMNGATYAAGMVNEAFSLDGLNDYVNVPGISAPQDKTYILWVKINAHPGTWNTLIEFGNDAPWFGIAGTGQVALYLNNPITSSSLNTGEWYHIAYTSDNATNTSKIYINGVQDGPDGTAKTEMTTGMGIGYHSEDTPFDGLIDEVAIFNRALTAEEIASIYYAGSAGKCVCVDPPSNMVSWWKGENNTDDSLGTNNGTLIGDTIYEPGKVGQAFSFDGVGDYVSVPDSPSLDITDQITLDAWIYPTALGGRIVNKITAGFGDGYLLDTSGGVARFIAGNEVLDSATGLPLNKWTHVAATYNGTTMTVYVNGLPDGSVAASIPIPTNNLPLRIGADSSGASAFSGLIDEVEIFDRALTAGEIAAIYNAGSAGKCSIDTIPDQFIFTDQTDVNLNTVVESNTITVSGINSAAPISITGCTGTNCEYSINSGVWTSTDGTVDNGDTVEVRQTSSWSYSATTNLTLYIGTVFDVFSVTTLAVPPGPLPDLTGEWYEPLAEKCKMKKGVLKCKVKGKFILRNIGEVEAEYVVLRFYLSDDNILDGSDILLKASYKKKVIVGKDYKKSFKLTLPVGMSLEGRYIIVYIDAEEATVESNESNNFVVYGSPAS